MSTCEHCTTHDHDRAGCVNTDVPMIHRSCNCGCQRRDTDPAPYWTAHADEQRRDVGAARETETHA